MDLFHWLEVDELVDAIERPDADPGVCRDGGERHSSALPSHRSRGSREHAVAVGRRVATQLTATGAVTDSCPGFAHTSDDGRS